MDQSTPRTARLQAIRDKWFSEPLNAQFPALTDDTTTLQPPANCQELVASTRVTSAFSSLHHDPDMAGMSRDEALAHDRGANLQRFRVEDPAALLAELTRQFDRAPSGQVEPEVLKASYVLLDEMRTSSLELVNQFGGDAPAGGKADDAMKRLMRESYLADADAIGQAQRTVHELAGELGISLPMNRDSWRRG